MTTRVLFVTQTAHAWGGVEVWMEYLTGVLAARGWEVTVGLVRGRRFHDPDRYRAAHALPATIDIPALTGTTEGRVRAVLEAIRRTSAEVVVPVNIADALEAVRRLKSRGANVRLFYPLHGLTSDYFDDVRAFRGVIDFAGAVNRLAARALVAVSSLAEERVAYTPCGVAAPECEPSFAGGALRLLFVGRLTQLQKRALDLVPLCRELDRRGVPYRLDIVGEGEALPSLREALSSSPSVHFAGLRTQRELYRQFYPGASAMLVLSDWETGPLVAWEAMRHGATIVTTDYLGRKAEGALVDGETALVAPIGDTTALATHLERLASDGKLLERLRRAAYAKASRDYTLEWSIEAWESALRSAMAVAPAIDARGVPLPSARSRLDALLGRAAAEGVRRILGRGLTHADPGAEWPHSWHRPSADVDAAVATLDR